MIQKRSTVIMINMFVTVFEQYCSVCLKKEKALEMRNAPKKREIYASKVDKPK